MNDSEQNFEDLKQLLKLKRYEIPPPGYFNDFSSHVISAIREERASGVLPASSGASWIVRFLAIFDSRPGLVGGLATSLVLLLVFGVVLADHTDSDMQSIYPTETSAQATSPMAATSASDLASAGSDSSGGITVSTNPVASLQPASGLFGQPNPLFQTASFSLAANPSH
ncbi:MAG: hypothetical protein ABSF34_13900 [Verrucomicrobiota bacterium]